MTITLVADAPTLVADARFDEEFPCPGVDDEPVQRRLRTMTAHEVLDALNLCRWDVEEIKDELNADDLPPPETVSAEYLRRKVELVESLGEALPRYGRLVTAVFSTIPPAFHRILTTDDAVRRFWPGGRAA